MEIMGNCRILDVKKSMGSNGLRKGSSGQQGQQFSIEYTSQAVRVVGKLSWKVT